MKSYYRVMLGKKNAYAAECFAGGYIGSGFGGLEEDVSANLTEEWRAFNHHFMPVLAPLWPDKSKIALGLWCGFAWTICKGVRKGDRVLSPDGTGTYRVGEVGGDYYFVHGGKLPHRRPVTWLDQTIRRADMSDALKGSTGSMGTVSDISDYRDEIETLLGVSAGLSRPMTGVAAGEALEDAATFVLEKYLQEFLVSNWAQTELAKDYEIFSDDGQQVGSHFLTDTGPLDILAISKDKKRLLVVELKKGRASDSVVGQVLRYMGYVQEELAEEGQTGHGIIIALEDNQKIRRALAMTPNISFYRYQVSFKLMKG